jgi:hypothetical protein
VGDVEDEVLATVPRRRVETLRAAGGHDRLGPPDVEPLGWRLWCPSGQPSRSGRQRAPAGVISNPMLAMPGLRSGSSRWVEVSRKRRSLAR